MTEIAQAQTEDPRPPDCPPDKSYVLLPLQKKVVHWVRTYLSSCHPSITATLQLLRNSFWWHSMQADTIIYINNNSMYAISKSSRWRIASIFQALPIPQPYAPLDFVIDLPVSQGDTTILTLIDCFSNACWLIPLPKRPATFDTAELFLSYVFWY